MSTRHVNIPIFIPHLGCPNQCVFCNQRTISGRDNFDVEKVVDEIETALSTISSEAECEIAFFGGSFTGIDRALMIRLLDIAESFVVDGRVKSVRCSTRPDYISREILDILAGYTVRTIELGLQSSSDAVLSLSERGHGYVDELNACRLIKEYGFDLVGQMMIGLPGSDLNAEMMTAEFIVNSGASAARIYPTVVFYDTKLQQMCKDGSYMPLELDDAVERTACVFEYLIENNVKVIRTGLCASENLSNESSYYAGPNHPALGELVESRVLLKIIKKKLNEYETREGDTLKVFVAKGFVSKAIGQKRINRRLLTDEFGLRDVRVVEKETLQSFEIEILIERNEDRCT